MSNKIVETSRLILRKFSLNDLDELALITADPEVMYYSLSGVKTRLQTEQFINWSIDNYQKYGFGLYAVIYKKTKKLIGYCGLLVWDFEIDREIEIGYRLATQYWGRGLGTEAAKAILNYGYNKLGIKNFICIIEPDNLRSIGVAKKLEMIAERKIKIQGVNVIIYRRKIHKI